MKTPRRPRRAAPPPAADCAAIAADHPVVALVLQGGGALGSYQGGVIEGLQETGIEPNRVAGISIGALNAAVFAGDPRETRVARLRGTLERFVDFDRLNAPECARVSVGAVDVETGNFAWFDNRSTRPAPEHLVASGALPPGFPTVRIDGRWY